MEGVSCVYGIYIGGRLIYIGRTANILKRASRHLTLAYNQKRENDGNLYTVLHICISNGIIPRFKILSTEDWQELCFIIKNRNKLVCNVNVGGVTKRRKMPLCETNNLSYQMKRSINKRVLSGLVMQIDNLNKMRTYLQSQSKKSAA